MATLNETALEHEAVQRFCNTWAANCGAAPATFRGQLGIVLAELLRDRDKLWCEALIPEGPTAVNRICGRFNVARPDNENIDPPTPKRILRDDGPAKEVEGEDPNRLDKEKFGPHRFPGVEAAEKYAKKHGGAGRGGFFTSDCTHGCGAWMGDALSGGPDGGDELLGAFGLCPKNPLSGGN